MFRFLVDATRCPSILLIPFLFSFFKNYLSIWLYRVLVAAMGSFLVVHGLSSCGVQDPQCTGSIVAICGFSCSVACGILVSRPGIKSMFPALRGKFLTIEPPGKSPIFLRYLLVHLTHIYGASTIC